MKFKASSKVNAEFNMSSLTDIIFLLLIFFVVITTVYNVTGFKVDVPNAKGDVQKADAVVLAVNSSKEYSIDGEFMPFDELEPVLRQKLIDVPLEQRKVQLRIDKDLDVQTLVDLYQICRNVDARGILATDPKD
jgi:biopolymer transport protein ExbD